MRGVESIIGAYFAVMIIMSMLLGFYTWFREMSFVLSDQLEIGVERIKHVVNPPVLSVDYVNSSNIKLLIYPYTSLYVNEVLMKDPWDRLIHRELVEREISSPYEVVLPMVNRSVSIVVISRNGIVFHYIPRLDPSLSPAPDYVKNKIYLDEEIIGYLSYVKNREKPDSWILLRDIGYKLYIGIPNTTVNNILINEGPVLCEFNPYASRVGSCNVVSLTYPGNRYFLTYNGFMRSVYGRPLFYHNDTVLNIISDVGRSVYLQVYRVVRIANELPVSIKVNMSIRGYAYGSPVFGNIAFSVIPVVYIYETKYNVVLPVTRYQDPSISSPWINRILLEETCINTTTRREASTPWINKTYVLNIDLGKLALREAYVFIGIEVVALSHSLDIPAVMVSISIE